MTFAQLMARPITASMALLANYERRWANAVSAATAGTYTPQNLLSDVIGSWDDVYGVVGSWMRVEDLPTLVVSFTPAAATTGMAPTDTRPCKWRPGKPQVIPLERVGGGGEVLFGRAEFLDGGLLTVELTDIMSGGAKAGQFRGTVQPGMYFGLVCIPPPAGTPSTVPTIIANVVAYVTP